MKKSKLWDSLLISQFSKIDDNFLASFREPGTPANRLATWDPFERSTRYFKFLLFNQLDKKNSSFFDRYACLGPTSIGNPVYIKTRSGLEINLDHFLAVEELMFIEDHIPLREIRHVIEIGAGFGRTAQAFVSLIDNLERYTIIDLPEMLTLSRGYLTKVFAGGGGASFRKNLFF